jgi:hypothetical protein
VRHTVRPSKAKLHQPTLRVSGCDLEAGHRQVGLLVVDCVRTTVLDNRIHAAPRAGKALGFAELVKDRHYRDRGRRPHRQRHPRRRQAPAGGVTNTTVKAGNRAVHSGPTPTSRRAGPNTCRPPARRSHHRPGTAGRHAQGRGPDDRHTVGP